MTGVFIWTQSSITEGRTADHDGGDWRGCQGCLKLLEQSRSDSSQETSDGVWSCSHLDLERLASRTVGE
jgi:hypothetical protein